MGEQFRPARWGGSGKKSVQARHTSTPQTPPAETPTTSEGPDATDAAKALAAEHDINLASIAGTGAEGRITKEDVAALLEQAEPEQPELAPADSDTPTG